MRALFWALLTGFLALDQGVKAWIRGSLSLNQSLDAPWPGVFEIKHVTNEGIAFGMFQGMGVMLAPIAIGIAIFAIFYSSKHPRESGWTHAAMALLAAGALGNLYDRVFLGGVTDMFWFRAIDFPVFNIADACITGATIILIIKWGLEALPSRKPVLAEGVVLGQEDGRMGGLEEPENLAREDGRTGGLEERANRGAGETGDEHSRFDRFLEATSDSSAVESGAIEAEAEGASAEVPESISSISDIRQVESSDPETETPQAKNQSS